MTKSHSPQEIRAFIERNYPGLRRFKFRSIGQMGELYIIFVTDKFGNEFKLKHTVAEVDKY